MKKLTALITAIALAFIPFSAFSANSDVYASEALITKTVTVSGGNTGGEMTVDISYDPAWITDNTYNSDLASFTSVLSAGMYSNTTLNNRPKIKKLLRSFGFKNVKSKKITSPDGKDPDDITDIVLGHRTDNVSGTLYDTYIVVINGSDGSGSQWTSNFDMGNYKNDDPALHPDWLRRYNHKGFDVTATRIDRVITEYMAAYLTPDTVQKLIITGHSRGASIANILGTLHPLDSVAYTFASPNTTTSDAVFTNIYNIVNAGDMISKIPPAVMGYHRYGTDIICDVSKTPAVRDFIEKNSGQKYSIAISHHCITTYAIASLYKV